MIQQRTATPKPTACTMLAVVSTAGGPSGVPGGTRRRAARGQSGDDLAGADPGS